MKKIRILLTGGGSGGHIYPLIAVVEELKKIAADEHITLDARYFGDPGSYEPELAGNGIRVVRVTGSKIRRYFTILHVIDFIKFIWSIPQALSKVFWFMPDVAFSKGGPGAVSIVNACAFYRVPIVAHDSDAVPGLTSRVTARYAALIELAFNSAADYVAGVRDRVRIVGNPIRAAMRFRDDELTVAASHEAKLQLNVEPGVPLLLVLGGSQGAATLNKFISENLAEFLPRYQVLHQVGVENYDEYVAQLNANTLPTLPKDIARRYRPVPFFAGTHFTSTPEPRCEECARDARRAKDAVAPALQQRQATSQLTHTPATRRDTAACPHRGVATPSEYPADTPSEVAPGAAGQSASIAARRTFEMGSDMRTSLQACDLVISRAGAGAIFEIAAAGKPSVIVPLPNAAYDHQRENAFRYHEAGACVVIEEENLIGNLVRAEIDGLFQNPERLKKMSENARIFAKPDAALAIAKDILSLTN